MAAVSLANPIKPIALRDTGTNNPVRQLLLTWLETLCLVLINNLKIHSATKGIIVDVVVVVIIFSLSRLSADILLPSVSGHRN